MSHLTDDNDVDILLDDDGTTSLLDDNQFGNLNVTEAIEALAAIGSVAITGGAVVTEAGETLAAAGGVAVDGALSVTEAAEGLTAEGSAGINGTLSATEELETFSAAGTVAIAGALDVTEPMETLEAFDSTGVNGSLNVTEALESLSAAGTAAIDGEAIVTEVMEGLAAAGAVAIAGALDIVEEAETLVTSSTGGAIGHLDATETIESIDAQGAVAIAGAMAVAEAIETIEASGFAGDPPVTGELTVTEALEGLAASGAVAITGSGSVVEAGESLSASGTVAITGSLNAVEESETISTSSLSNIRGNLNVVEEGETLNAKGHVSEWLGPDHCPPDFKVILHQLTAKYPRGWAWDAVVDPGTHMHQLARGWAWMHFDIVKRACQLLPEFVCHHTQEMLPEWWADYGLPDDCGINDLCAKVRAIGGANCSYFTELADYLGFANACCEDIPIEIQPGGWNLGCAPMPPAPAFDGGGSLLGYAMLDCPPDDCGSDLGHDVLGGEDCNVAGFRECVEVTPIGSVCRTVAGCVEYVPPSVGVLLTGCPTPYVMRDYTGTGYHWRFGVPNELAHLLGSGGEPWRCDMPQLCDDWETGVTGLGTFVPGTDPVPGIYPITGCWEMGCAPLCEPSQAPLICFINELKPAHTVAVPIWCGEEAA